MIRKIFVEKGRQRGKGKDLTQTEGEREIEIVKI